jgi:hypothetical protein
MTCAECGGGAVIWNQLRIGCANARNKGTCANKHTIRRDALEAAVLDGLQHHLMAPELTEVFCKEYTAHMNRLRKEHVASEAGTRAELQKITREIDRLIQAICDGVPGSQVKDRMTELEARKTEITLKLDGMETPPPLLHPNMADYYRQQVTKLRDALNDEAHRAEAADILRTLIDRIELRPVTTKGQKTLAIDLHGELAGILSLASKQKGMIGNDVATECTKMMVWAAPPTASQCRWRQWSRAHEGAIINERFNNRSRSGKERFSGARRRPRWTGRRPQEATPAQAARLLCGSFPMSGWHGSLQQCPSLGQGDQASRA